MTDRPAPIRLLVRPPGALAPRRATAAVKRALANCTWGSGRSVHTSEVEAPNTSAARNDLLVEVASTERSFDTYAAHAHELVQLLYDSELFLRVEADLPTPAFDPDGVTITGPRRKRLGAADSPGCAGNVPAAPHDWALRDMNVPAALALMAPGRRGGKGIVVGHPDSGYSDHPMLGLGQLDLTRDRDVISGDNDARDPLHPPKKTPFNLLPNPGHGSSTASVLVGVGEGSVGSVFRGVATAATLVPIRATESVVQVFDTDVAKAVRWARQHDCHVVSMSLGGKGLFGLEDAIQEAVDAGMVVLAAAGNQVGFVTAPASYDNCLAVAATTSASAPWDGSSRGSQVDVAAPGSCVWCALFDWKPKPPGFVLRQSDGTSYAVAHVAGVVALWMAHHGHDALVTRFGRGNIQAALLSLLRTTGVCRVPAGWNHHKWGAGIIDANALLQAPLPAPHAFAGRHGAAPTPERDPLDRLSASLGRPLADIRRAVDRILGPDASDNLELVRRFEGELAFHLADPASRTAILARGKGAVAPPPIVLNGASPQLRARVAAAR